MYLFIITLLFILLQSSVGFAQRGMIKVHFKDTTTVQYPQDRIDSLTHFNIDLATITTLEPQSITGQSLYCGGKILNNGNGNISEVGLCWGSKPNPTRSNAWTACNLSDSFYYCMIGGLSRKSTYYVRAYAINEAGISYGNDISVSTSSSGGGTLIYQGYEYSTIIACNGIEYLAENLKTDRYQNGDTIRRCNSLEDLNDAFEKREGAYCYFNFDSKNDTIYGKLYNWFAIYDSRKIGPIGWTLPSARDDDFSFSSFIDCLGGPSIAGGKMKTIGNAQDLDGNWNKPNIGASNTSGFSGQPGGFADFSKNSVLWNGLGDFGRWPSDFGLNNNSFIMLTLSNNTTNATLEIVNGVFKMHSLRMVKEK